MVFNVFEGFNPLQFFNNQRSNQSETLLDKLTQPMTLVLAGLVAYIVVNK